MTLPRRRTACRMRHCCARRIVETGGRRKLVCTSTRWAERHPQGVCRIRKAAEPPTAAQQRMIGAEANRIAASNAATPRAGILIPEAQKSFEPETANQKPFSWGSKGAILFCEREWPLCPCRPQAAYPSAPCVERSLRPLGEKRAVLADSSFQIFVPYSVTKGSRAI